MSAPTEEDVDVLQTDDYYAWLGLSREASVDDINNAFRRLSRIYHPDKHAGSPQKSKDAQELFTKLKKAHEVLSDPHTKAIYDTMGVKGLETEGWQVVARTKTPQEILEEYERLQQEREERRLRNVTNPRGSVAVNIDATDLFDSHTRVIPPEDEWFHIPEFEITNMTISQAVDAPLTTKDTVELSGIIANTNGIGSGTLTSSYRRVMSHKAWAEMDISVGSGNGFAFRSFRTHWNHTYTVMSGSMQITSKGIKPAFSVVLGTELDKGLSGRIVWNALSDSSMQTILNWKRDNHLVNVVFKLGLSVTFASLRYSYSFEEHECKVRSCIRAGTFGVILEYGCDKQITQFSRVSATMLVGNAVGVLLRIRLTRGQQNYIARVSLSDELSPAAIFYGTVVPVVAYFVVKKLIIAPFLKDQEERDVQKKKEANAEKIAKNKKDAEAALELMTETVERSIETEERKGGLVIRKALFGKLIKDNEDISEADCINVTKPLQALVTNSEIRLVGKTEFSELPGFYDPCLGEDKELSILYEFRRKMHYCRLPNKSALHIPARAHMCADQNNHNGSGDAPGSSVPSSSHTTQQESGS